MNRADSDLLDEIDQKSDRKEKTRTSLSMWQKLSYTTRVTISFALIAAMTAVVAIGVVSLVWEQHFQTYTRENVQLVANNTAEQIADLYENEHRFSENVLQPAKATVAVSPGIGMQVLDLSNEVKYDSTTELAKDNRINSPSLAPLLAPEAMAHAAIVVDNHAVGTVRVWVYGSDTLLRTTDQEFRDKSYQALVIATVLAIVIASFIGYFFARNLVRPINKIMRTATEVKEGDLSARTGMWGEDEVAQLGETFDAMTESLERDRDLERRLTTDVAHELRTPLMAIQSTVEAMIDDIFPADHEHLTIVNSEVQRLSRLVDSLLKLSRLENRNAPIKEETVDVSNLIADIIGTHESYVRDAGLELDYYCDPDTIVIGDPDMIRQATANLISNAVRYTPEGSITVRVDQRDGFASISVCDTGIGLTPEEARMVFSRFWRADAGRTRERGGLGIGLSVVKEIVDRHNGFIDICSKKDKGTCFVMNFPLYGEKGRLQDFRKKPSRHKFAPTPEASEVNDSMSCTSTLDYEGDSND